MGVEPKVCFFCVEPKGLGGLQLGFRHDVSGVAMAEVTKMVTSPRSVHEIRRVGVMTDQCAAQSARFHPS